MSYLDPFSLNAAPHARVLSGFGVLDTNRELLKYVQDDHGLSLEKKQRLLTMLNSPEMMDHLLVGATGAYIAKVLSSYTNMSKPSRILLSLAGYGIGNIIYNALLERKFTDYNPHTAVATIKL